jgi:hypothetical protein
MKVIFLIMSLVVSGNLYAEPAEPFAVLNIGTTSCGSVVDALNGGNHEQQYIGYINGFITGINFIEGGRLGLGVEEEAKILFIKNYCNENPLDPLIAALSELENELRKRL